MNPNLDAILKQTDRVMNATDGRRGNFDSFRPPKVHVGVDLGTAYTVLIVLDEQYLPIAGEYQFAQVTRDGLVVDFVGAVDLLQAMKSRVEKRLGFELTSGASGYPPGVPQPEVRATANVLYGAGLDCTGLIDEPTAANNVLQIQDGAIVDVGGGTTDIAVISLGGIVADGSIRIGGQAMDRAIVVHTRRQHNMLIGEPTAESVKIELACALPEERPRTMEVRGRDLVSGIPRGTTLRSDEIARAIHEPIQAIVAAVVRTLEATPPELASDIVDEGITLTGGGSLIRGLDELIRQRTGVPVRVAEDPLTAVVRGTAAILEDFDRHRDLLRV